MFQYNEHAKHIAVYVVQNGMIIFHELKRLVSFQFVKDDHSVLERKNFFSL